jgi:hypothetical protein
LQPETEIASFYSQGGLAQLARAFAWHAKGHRFDSGNLHKEASVKEVFIFKPSPQIIVINNMGVWNQIAEYLYLKKKDPNRPKSKWIGYMHGINRISLLIFILCLIILAIKLLT